MNCSRHVMQARAWHGLSGCTPNHPKRCVKAAPSRICGTGSKAAEASEVFCSVPTHCLRGPRQSLCKRRRSFAFPRGKVFEPPGQGNCLQVRSSIETTRAVWPAKCGETLVTYITRSTPRLCFTAWRCALPPQPVDSVSCKETAVSLTHCIWQCPRALYEGFAQVPKMAHSLQAHRKALSVR